MNNIDDFSFSLMCFWIKIRSLAAEFVKIGIDTAIIYLARLYLLQE